MRSGYNIQFVTAAALLEAPRPRPLIAKFIQEQETVALWGEPNGGKSFVTLDMALCIATGKPWLDTYAVKQSPIIYMAGEGAASLQLRVEAWKQYHGIKEISGAYFQLRPLPLREEEVIGEIQAVLDDFARNEFPDDPVLRTGLIVVDTLSQFFGGGDENGPDMALFVNNIRRLSQEQNTAVLVVHHSNAGNLRERGHTALRGNVDVMFNCSPTYTDHVLTSLSLVNDKQRDNPRAVKHELKLHKVVLREATETTDEVSSLVLVPTLAPPSKVPDVPLHLMDCLTAFTVLEDEKTEKCLNTAIEEAIGKTRSGTHKNLRQLSVMGLVKYGTGKSWITLLGREALDKARKDAKRRQ